MCVLLVNVVAEPSLWRVVIALGMNLPTYLPTFKNQTNLVFATRVLFPKSIYTPNGFVLSADVYAPPNGSFLVGMYMLPPVGHS
jgi:hypothetical protein